MSLDQMRDPIVSWLIKAERTFGFEASGIFSKIRT